MSEAICAINNSVNIKANYIALGCGKSVDLSVLRSITPSVLFMCEPSPMAFISFFKWVTQSVDITSKNVSGPSLGQFELPKFDSQYFEITPQDFKMTVDKDHQKFLLSKCVKTRGSYIVRFEKRTGEYKGEPITAYEAIAAHKVERFDVSSSGDAEIENPMGGVACPYCGNNAGGICECGKSHCLSSNPEERKFVKCPHCESVNEFGDGGVGSLRGGNG